MCVPGETHLPLHVGAPPPPTPPPVRPASPIRGRPFHGPVPSPPVDPFRYAHEHRDEIVWMSQNTNHIPTDPRIGEAMIEAIRRGEHNYYPFAKGIFGLPELVREDLGVPADTDVAIQHGGLEAAYVLSRALLAPGDNVVASDPSFLPIHNQIALCGATVKELPIYAPPWKLTVDQVNEAIDARTKMLLLIDPLNPLGTQYSRAEVRAMAEIASDRDVTLVHDITYHDFAFDPALAGEFAPERTLYVYSFSKNVGFAGMRLGALLGPRALMDRIRPFFVSTLGVNVVAQRGAKVALETKKDWIGRVVATARENQRIVKDAVESVDGLSVCQYPSSSNTLCFDVSARGLDPSALERELLFSHGVFVRGGPYLSKRFGSRFVRVSFTVPTEGARKFASALPKAVEAVSVR